MARKIRSIGYSYLERFKEDDLSAALPFLEACARVVADFAPRLTESELRRADPALWNNLLQAVRSVQIVANANPRPADHDK